MQLEQLEKLAANGKPIPDDLPPPETMLYYMLLGVYAAYHSREISAEQGKEQKRQILNTYKRVKEDYEQYVGICKEYQRSIRERYIYGKCEKCKSDDNCERKVQ